MTLQAGQYVTDGTAVFILDDIRDGNRVGDIVFRPVLHDGYIKANGATVTASEYPRLLKFAQDNNLLVDSSAWNSDKSKYVYDSSADTLKIPDAQGRVLQGATDRVKSVEEGLPNITGSFYDFTVQDNLSGGIQVSGALYKVNDPSNAQFKVLTAYTASFAQDGIGFDASRSNPIYGASDTVQPPALALIPQIKY